MRETTLLRYLIKRLKEEGIIKYDKDFLTYINTQNIVTPKQLSDYLRRDGEIRNKQFVKEIIRYFNLPKNICQLNNKGQIKALDNAVEEELKKIEATNEDALNLSNIITLYYPRTKEQIELLDKFNKLDSKQKQIDFLNSLKEKGLLEKKVQNQEFLVYLLKSAYDKGLYKEIIELIIPNLYRNYHSLVEVQKIEAHSLGSLGDYKSAQHILSVIIDKNIVENINLRTSALSNKKRELLSQKTIDKEELYKLIVGYKELFFYQNIHSYYTGINLVYLVVLGQVLFPTDNRFSSIDTQEIYNLSKPSLKEDKTHNDYYNKMSELEFKLLLCYDGIIEKIESFLANYEPHFSLVERTLRQMKIILNHIDKTEHIYVILLKKAITILNDYIIFASKN